MNLKSRCWSRRQSRHIMSLLVCRMLVQVIYFGNQGLVERIYQVMSIPDLRISKQLGRRFWPGAGSLLAFGAQQGDAMLGF